MTRIRKHNWGRRQTFTYDQVNRITTAGTAATTGSTCWGYQFTYDAWGNLLSQAGWSPTYNACTENIMGAVTADGNNHISGLSYDGSGNTQADGINTYTWDGESQLKTAAGVTYNYDGDGRRAAKVGSKLYWYGSGGEILAETDAAGNTLNDYIFFGGKRVALVPASGGALYYAEDTLGSSRVVVQSNGVVCYDADFVPFGGEKTQTNSCAQNYKFEGKERDTETQNDDFGARYYSWRFGRWLSSDWSAVPVPVPYANLTNPQTLNLYSMVADDPESFADLDGHLGFWGPAALSQNNPQCSNAQGSGANGGCSTSTSSDPNQPTQNPSLAADIANVVEVSGSAGVGSHGEIQLGTVELSGGYNVIGVEGTTGLAGGNANATVLTGVQGEAKVPGASVEGKAGAELSTKEGATIGASVSGHAGPLSGEVKVDTNGVHTSAQAGGNKDIKLGAHAQIGLGVGVTVNLSQAARAAEHARQSGLALVNYLVNKFMPSGPIF